jgi:hypothetical protein
MLWLGLASPALAGSYTITTTTLVDTALTLIVQRENQERVDRGEPLTRFCTDNPAICATIDIQGFLNWRVQGLAQNERARRNEEKARRIQAFCAANPNHAACDSVDTAAQGQ